MRSALLPQGSHTLKVKAFDALGHEQVKELKYATGDTQPPALKVSGWSGQISVFGHAEHLNSFGANGSGDGQFGVATDVAVDPTDGTTWVADDENNRVQHFSSAGQYLGKFSVCEDPASVLPESQGNVYVACGAGLKKYSDTGQLLQTVATRGYAAGQVSFVTDMALDSEGGLWVASHESGEVKHFAANGTYLGAFSTGSTVGRPWGIAVSPSGEIFVTTGRVTVFDKQGKLLRSFGTPGSGDGQFNFASDVEVDEHGYAWVADAGNDRIQVFNPAGEYVQQIRLSRHRRRSVQHRLVAAPHSCRRRRPGGRSGQLAGGEVEARQLSQLLRRERLGRWAVRSRYRRGG